MELKKISKEELNKIIKDHKHWLCEDCEGWEKMRADLSYSDLRDADLSYANLSYADLRGANLNHADLTDANLKYANLNHANLNHADLTGANLKYANLNHADLSNANLSYADLRGVSLNEVKYNHLTAFFSLQCPEKGAFIGYKKSGDKIVELRIEEDSKRSSATSRKCRASKVTVLSITSIDGKEEFKKSENTGLHEFTYEVGKTYEIGNFDNDRWNECSTGIHFFITRDEAVRYSF